MIWDYIFQHMICHKNSLLFSDTLKFTYKEILNMAITIGEQIKRKYPSKSKVAILCKDELHSSIALLACFYAKMVAIPTSARYGNKLTSNIIELIKPDLIITDCEIGNNLGIPNTYFIHTQRFKHEDIVPVLCDVPNDVVLMMCTSGTTGIPKATMITEYGLIENIKSILMYFKILPSDTMMIPRPIYHCAVLTGELLVSLLIGTNIYFYNGKYNPLHYAQKTREYNITILCGTPTMFAQLILYNRKKTAIKLRIIVVSGECMTDSVAMRIRSYFRNTQIYHVYGLTEASPRVSFLSPDRFDDKPTSVGQALNGIEINIRDITHIDKVLQANQIGIIMAKTPSCMLGYYKNSQATQKAIINGWLNTNDIGYIDNEGYLYICSRADDMIIKAGMNIYPLEIENCIIQLEVIDDVIAYGTKDGFGEHITIEVVSNQNISEKELRNMLVGVLPDYQMPRQIIFSEQIPRGITGKKIRTRKTQYDKRV